MFDRRPNCPSRIEEAQAGLQAYMRELSDVASPTQKVAVVTFSTSANILVAPSSPAALDCDAVCAAMTAGSGTCLTSALRAAGEVFRDMPNSLVRRVILITDGEHNGDTDPVPAAQLLKAEGVRIHGIACTTEAMRTLASLASEDPTGCAWVRRATIPGEIERVMVSVVDGLERVS
jgi:uncharacterized protein YegL